MASARRKALEKLNEIIGDGAYANLALKTGLHGLSERDVRFVTKLVYDTLENIIHADYIIGKYARGRIKPAIRNILRMGISEMLTGTEKAVACSESVKLTKEIGKIPLAGYVNGVMRSVSAGLEKIEYPSKEDKPLEYASIIHSKPLWLLKMWAREYGKEAAVYMAEADTQKELSLRPNLLKIGLPEFEQLLESKLLKFRRSELDENCYFVSGMSGIASDESYNKGLFSVQGIGAMVACRAVVPKRGMRILDACAAPGGKTAYMAELMGEGEIIAWDVHEHRVKLIEAAVKRLGIEFVTCSQSDARVPRAELENSFDAVLIDAPCSGLGSIDGRADALIKKKEDDIAALSKLQLEILEVCSRYVKPGGRLVYSTCTVSKRENEGVVSAFLKKSGEFSPVWDYEPAASLVKDGRLQLLPHIHGDGFFVASMERSGA
ncbi:MAG: 16S rRNA (cytosine(967)-C(5))-methyltransferase RsmB [Christensenellales bacterium]|jgi:16S rRNA (cytosine967-C5)-methyltransferase